MVPRLLILLPLLLLSRVSYSQGLDQSIGPAVEATSHNEIMRDDAERILEAKTAGSSIGPIVRHLADVIGPRLTGSPAALEAGQWTAGQLRNWGLNEVHLEPWIFGHPGWRNVEAQGQLLGPSRQPLHFGVVAWTPGTNGAVQAPVVIIDPPQDTDTSELNRYLDSVRARVKGRIVMIGPGRAADPNPWPPTIDEKIVSLLREGKAAPFEPAMPSPGRLTIRQRDERINAFLKEAGAKVRVDDSARAYGVLQARANPTFEPERTIPSVVLKNEDYARITRIVACGQPVALEFNIDNRTFADGQTSYNVIGDIVGSEKPDELVILGSHLDSWHLSPGVVDNAVGVAVVMEVARLIQELGIRPRRTIRIALWTGEEQYLLGSQAYVESHFGTSEKPTANFSKVAAYINIDNGSGRVRGANIFGPPAAAATLRKMFELAKNLGIEGVIPHSVRRLGATDATTFSHAGITSIGLVQDPLDYPVVRHSDLDTPERIDLTQTRQAAMVTALLALAIADSSMMPPKFDATSMPAVIDPPGQRLQRNTK